MLLKYESGPLVNKAKLPKIPPHAQTCSLDDPKAGMMTRIIPALGYQSSRTEVIQAPSL